MGVRQNDMVLNIYTLWHPKHGWSGERIYSENDAMGMARVYRNKDENWIIRRGGYLKRVTGQLAESTFYLAVDGAGHKMDMPHMTFERANDTVKYFHKGYVMAVTDWEDLPDMGKMNSEAP